jgi:hypothetical protein
MHPTEGQLRAFLDGESSETEMARLRAHFESCPSCRLHAESMQAYTGQVTAALAALDATPAESAALTRDARSHFEAYSSTKEKITMFQKMFAPRFRLAWAALIVFVVLATAFSLPPVRAFADNVLGIFRVKQVSVVPFDPLNLPQNFNVNQQTITQLMAQNLQIETVGKAQEGVTAAEASNLAGIPVRLPTSSKLPASTPTLSVQPGTKLSFKVDLARIQSILSEAGFGDIQLPKQLDGATVKADLPQIVTAVYGDLQIPDRGPGAKPDMGAKWCNNCAVLVQLTSPTIQTPDGVDLAAIGQAYLRLTGMTAAEAQSFSQTVDWSTTLVIPVPNFATHDTVSVDGVNGMFIQGSTDNGNQYLLIWVKDNIVYGLTGYGSSQDAVDIANSLK